MKKSFELKSKNTYYIECYDRDGNLKWSDYIYNLVVTEGLNKFLDATIKTGLSSPTWYVGLVSGATTPSYSLSDTLASHSGWTEFTGYSGNRKQFIGGTITNGSIDNSGNKAEFSITSSGTVAGSFICSAESGTSGVLLGEGNFEQGSKSVSSGDTIRVTLTLTMSNPS